MFRALAVLAAAAAAALAAAVPAAAGVLVASAPDCSAGPTSQAFAAWGDPAAYVLLPDGGFEAGGTGWDLAGAGVVVGNQPWGPGARLLRLPAGAGATSPTLCVGLEHPTARFFVRRAAAGGLGALRVDVLTETATGDVVAAPAGVVAAGSGWSPSPVVVNAAGLLPLLPGEHTPVRLRLTAVGGTVEVDDVYLDPYGRG